MALLLTYSDQQAIKAMSANNEGKYSQIATETEENDLKDLLGVALLQDLQDNPTEKRNVTLLDGGDYENSYDQTIKFKGLRYIIAYLNYARYLGSSFVSDTFSGFVTKSRAESEPISEGTIKRLQNENRQVAMREWEILKEFLDLNTDTYTLWISMHSKKPGTPQIYGVRTTLRKGEDTELRCPNL